MMSGMTAAIQVRGLTKAYGDLEVLRGVDLEVARGSIVALLGANGNGKSTLAKLLAGRLAPEAGDMHRDRRLRAIA